MTTLSPTSISLISGKNTFWSNATSVKVTTNGNVRPISGWTGGEIYRTGKNLIDPTISLSTQSNNPSRHGVINADGTLTVEYQDVTSWTARGYIELPAGTYRFYSGFGSSYNSRYLINDKGTEISWSGYKTITITETTKFRFRPAMGTDYPITGYLQVLKANEEYDPAPYFGATFPISWETEAGTIYGGYVDLISGEVWRTYCYISLKGTENFSDSGSWVIVSGLGADAAKNYKGLCSHYLYNAYNRDKVGVMPGYGMCVFDGNIYNAAGWKQYCKNQYENNTPITITYEIQTPILETTLSPSTLKSLRGQNNIWSNLNGTTTATYWTH